MENVIVVGGGNVGTRLATLLLAGGDRVKLIEVRREEVSLLQRTLSPEVVMEGSGTDPLILEAAGVRQAHVVAAVTGADEVNLVVTSLARSEFSVPRTIARVNNPRNGWLFTPEMGVDVALNQADVIAHLITEEMLVSEMKTLLKLHKGQYSLVEQEVNPTAVAAGSAVGDLHLPDQCVLAAILRQDRLVLPRPDAVLQPGDEILAIVHASELSRLAALLGSSKEP